MKGHKLVEFSTNFQCQVPLHKRKASVLKYILATILSMVVMDQIQSWKRCSFNSWSDFCICVEHVSR